LHHTFIIVKIIPDSVLAFYCSSSSWGGLEMNKLRFASWMHERGWRVKCFFVAGTPLFEEAKKSNLQIIPIQRNRKYFDIANGMRLVRLFKMEQVRLVWSQYSRDLSVLAWAKWLRPSQFRLLYQQNMQLGVAKRDVIHTIRYRKIDAWISPLPFLAEEVKAKTKFPSHRLHTIPLAIEMEKFIRHPLSRSEARKKLGIDETRTWMGVVGRLDVLKGQHLAIEALAQLASSHSNLSLLLVGESTRNEGNDYEMRLHKMAGEYGLKDRIIFLPFMKDVEIFYRAMDIFILASEGETFGMVTIEAMACGCAVIGTQSSGTPEILEHGKCGLLFEPGNSSQLANCISRLMNDRVLMKEISLIASEAAQEKFDHHRVCERIENEVIIPLLQL